MISLRVSLIVSMLALLATALAVFNAVICGTSSHGVREELEDELRVRAAEVADNIHVDGDAHGGTVSLSSDPGHGARFSIPLPAVVTAAEPASPVARTGVTIRQDHIDTRTS